MCIQLLDRAEQRRPIAQVTYLNILPLDALNVWEKFEENFTVAQKEVQFCSRYVEKASLIRLVRVVT